MNFENFITTVTNTVSDRMGAHYSVSTHNVTKNNGVILTGILIKANGNFSVAPTIYLNPYYDAYEKGILLLELLLMKLLIHMREIKSIAVLI